MLQSPERLMIKLGNKCVVNGDGVDHARVFDHAERIAPLLYEYDVAITSSGARSTGRRKIQAVKRSLTDRLDDRTLTAIGGPGAFPAWEEGFAQLELDDMEVMAAEIKATHDEIDDDDEGSSLLEVFKECFDLRDEITDEGKKLRVVPVFNINDPLDRNKTEVGRIEEGKDNDNAAAHLAVKLGAGTLMLLTAKVDGVMVDGRLQPVISVAKLDSLRPHFTATDEEGTGGMEGKLEAGSLALKGGVRRVLIGNSSADPRAILAGQTGTQLVQ